MSERTLTGGASFSIADMYRRGSDGKVVNTGKPELNEYCVPPKATRGRFVLSGISDVYVHEGQYGAKEKVRLEFEIEKLERKDLAHLVGMKFTQSVGWPKNIADPKSHLGQFLGALLNRAIKEGETISPDDFIGSSFVTATTLDESGDRQYPGISWDTIDPTKTKLSPFVAGATPEPELVGAAVGAGIEDSADPFLESEDL